MNYKEAKMCYWLDINGYCSNHRSDGSGLRCALADGIYHLKCPQFIPNEEIKG